MQKTENVSLKRTPLWYLFMLLNPITGHTASNPFQSAATGLLADFLAFVQPVSILAVAVSGIGVLWGMLHRFWFFGAIAGVLLAYGAPQIVSWIRGAGGV